MKLTVRFKERNIQSFKCRDRVPREQFVGIEVQRDKFL